MADGIQIQSVNKIKLCLRKRFVYTWAHSCWQDHRHIRSRRRRCSLIVNYQNYFADKRAVSWNVSPISWTNSSHSQVWLLAPSFWTFCLRWIVIEVHQSQQYSQRSHDPWSHLQVRSVCCFKGHPGRRVTIGGLLGDKRIQTNSMAVWTFRETRTIKGGSHEAVRPKMIIFLRNIS